MDEEWDNLSIITLSDSYHDLKLCKNDIKLLIRNFGTYLYIFAFDSFVDYGG